MYDTDTRLRDGGRLERDSSERSNSSLYTDPVPEALEPGTDPVAPQVWILRDPRESVKKCSLTPLRGMEGVHFSTYHRDRTIDVGERALLDPNGTELSERDRGLGLLVIDCAWRRVDALQRTVKGTLHRRRLPHLVTAYPRKSRIFEDPPTGLASVEALYAAVFLLFGPRPEFLEGYRWREEFLELNPWLDPAR